MLWLTRRVLFSPSLLKNVPFSQWTECQEKLFQVDSRKNVLLNSFTGSGKTLAYLLPAIQNILDSRSAAVVVVPTRELARQVGTVATSLVQGLEDNVKLNVLCAGAELAVPVSTSGSLIVATPGAMIRNIGRMNPESIKCIIIDEIDRLLDFGFIGQLENILRSLAIKNPRLIVASATFPRETELICKRILGNDFVRIESTASMPPGLSSEILYYKPREFLPCLSQTVLGGVNRGEQSLVVFPTTRSLMFFYSRFKTGIDLAGLLGKKMHVHALHGRMLDCKRKIISEKFSLFNHEMIPQILFSTDVAARGLDFPNLSLVCQVGFSGVDDPVAQFIHRSGRTARGGQSGRNVLLLGHGIDSGSKWVNQTPPGIPRADIELNESSFFSHEPSPYQKHLSTKCLESLLSWFLERKSMLGLTGGQSPTKEGLALERKGNLVKAITDMVRSGGVPEPRISSKLAKKLGILDIPGLHVSDRR
jgi:superfamily II DNA/RNA helicase